MLPSHSRTDMTNELAAACTIEGYPTIALFDAAGNELYFVYSHRGDQMVSGRRPTNVSVPAGGAAYFRFNKYRCDIHEVSVARKLQLALPGSAETLTVRLPPYPRMSYCPTDAPSQTIAVSAITRTTVATSARP